MTLRDYFAATALPEVIRAWLHWLCHGSDELMLPSSWLADTARLRAYEAWTVRQLDQGSVTRDCAAFRREAFWQHIAARQAGAPREVGKRLKWPRQA